MGVSSTYRFPTLWFPAQLKRFSGFVLVIIVAECVTMIRHVEVAEAGKDHVACSAVWIEEKLCEALGMFFYLIRAILA